MKKPIKKSSLALAILSLLIEEPMHPYRMQQLIKERKKDEVINVRHRTSIYQTIGYLLRHEAVAIREKIKNEGKPDLIIYEITDLGRNIAYSWLRDMLAMPQNEFADFPAAVSFLPLLSPEDVAEQLQKRVSTLEEMRRRLEEDLKSTKEMGLPRLFQLETEYKHALLLTEIQWVQSVIDDIHSKKIAWSQAWIQSIASQFSNITDTEK